MTDAETSGCGYSAGRAVELRVGARLENLALLRTIVGAIGAVEDLDVDTVADLRLALDELCTGLIGAASPNATLLVVIDPRDDEFVVSASTRCDTYEVVTPGSFSWHVLTSLTDDLQTFHDDFQPDEQGGLFGIRLTMRRAVATR